MAKIISDEIEGALLERGVLGDFMRRRDEMMMEEGAKRDEVLRRVLLELAPDLLEVPEELKREEEKPVVPDADETAEEKPKRVRGDAKRRGKSSDVVEAEPVKLVSSDVFAGKSCGISTAFMWAYSRLCIDKVKAKDAPSAVAWQMYQDMKRYPNLKSEMLRAGLSAAMRKAENDESAGDRFDGVREFDMLKFFAEGPGQ